jgi:L-ribulose-5-phosphate 3-epimerase UlaE
VDRMVSSICKIKNVSLRIQNFYLVIWPDVNCRSETYLEVAMWRVEVFICSAERVMALRIPL